MLYNNEMHNQFAAVMNKLIGQKGLIRLQNDVDYKIAVKQFTGFEVSEFYDDETDPMIFKLSFINGSGQEDAIEIWDSAIVDLDFTQPEVAEEWAEDGLKLVMAAVKDESNAIEFYTL
ncbi:hypothetical protein FHS15_000894 [Paenibacillus castaneae]|uniref:hypothetical protein n=1 Tax=Paenibacillus castaneae TaxID=474957 RepID=UPI000C99A8EA|nr:hypothetical protein [Paenibacillus castaneae]NIK75794.1 hypothetical protein [Paenibacillus castaneae]